MKTRLGIFASGNGSNALNFNAYFSNHDSIEVAKIYCNNPAAGILTKAFSYDIPAHLFTKSQLTTGAVLEQLVADKIDIIVLAGFLWLIPENLIDAFPSKIINIHPALLPKYGGKGMFGSNVHKAVIENKETESGITIHLVDKFYDHGGHLFQAKTLVDSSDTPETLAAKIHTLEHEHFPRVVADHIKKLLD